MPRRGAVSHRQQASKSVINTTNSRFDPPTSDRLVDWGIPYQCFSASSWLASCVPLSALAFSLQAMQQVASTFQRGGWLRVD
jgi:hypothetical protein